MHKANIMKYTDGLWLAVATEVAKDYPDIEFEERIVDNMCMQLVQKPELYDVLVLPNLYGDILSDLGAGLVGGLGVAPGANIGTHGAVFEPTHGSAPKYEGQNKVNPTAMILSGMLMLRHLRRPTAADRLESAVADVIAEGKHGDLRHEADRDDPTAVGTSEVADAIIEKLKVDCVSAAKAPLRRRRHRRGRPDRLQHPPPHRGGRGVRPGPAGHPPAPRDPGRQGPGGAPGRGHGARRLRLPAAARHGAHRTTRGWRSRTPTGPPRRQQAPRPGHGARRPAQGQRQDLHRAGPGDRRGRLGRRPGGRGRQPLQHQLHDRRLAGRAGSARSASRR